MNRRPLEVWPDRRGLLVSACALLLDGCSNRRYSALGAASGALLETVEPTRITWDEAAKVPYASLAVSLGDGPEALAILAEANDAHLRWSVGRDATLLTRGGRIVGWYQDQAIMIDRSNADVDPLARQALPTVPADCTRQIDFPSTGRFGISVQSRILDDGIYPIALASGGIVSRRLLEAGAVEELAWSFENEFYYDQRTGRFVGSRQAVHPDLPSIEFRVLRPYAGSDE